ncbi:MAG: formimidoylglutamate deiminase [Gemmatimonadaceae bacterium]|nr:formimidoylglutamate deiminase [Gemmatimonadaceae bacterium]
MSDAHTSPLWAPLAFIGGHWTRDVLLSIDASGNWETVEAGVACPAQARRLAGPVLPGVVNAHSHAFQRAFAGLTERRDSALDDFWSWRDRMYQVALRVSPEQLHAIARHLYAELLAGGFTHTCEFHYLHHDTDGRHYADQATMMQVLAAAAADVGMTLTMLPVLYERAGFAQTALREDQRRFATSVERVLSFRDTVRSWRLPHVTAGVAIHSLRAAHADSIRELVTAVRDDAAPIHIHVAEQVAEVEQCLAATGMRPVEWLVRSGWLDARWHLVHATHTTPDEVRSAAAAGAGVVLCPSTEANLGDGTCDLDGWLSSASALSVGTDSHITRAWPAELQLVEYGQRLVQRRRNVSADPERMSSTAHRLFQRFVAGGAAAAGWNNIGIQVGARADFVVLNTETDALLGVPDDFLLDALVFSGSADAFRETWMRGQRCHEPEDTRRAAREAMRRAMKEIWS